MYSLENQDKVLAEATPNLRWGTGMSAYVTENTRPEFWAGQNPLGMMLMDIPINTLTDQQQISQATTIEDSIDNQDDEIVDEKAIYHRHCHM